jgi:CO/xanthine dehydrogenase Mo-binding subunit
MQMGLGGNEAINDSPTQAAEAEPESAHFELTRRRFFSWAGAGGISIAFHDLALASKPLGRHLDAALEHESNTRLHEAVSGWSGGPGRARYRIEGLAKVTGQKIYARDFRSKDMGWPGVERVAMILRAVDPLRLFMGLDLSMLPADVQPLLVITQKKLLGLSQQQVSLDTLNLSLPFSSNGPEGSPAGLLVAGATTAVFYGQPVAILIFPNADTYRKAKRLLQFNTQVVQYGALVPQPPPSIKPPPYKPVNHLTRFDVRGIAPFSQVQVGVDSNPFAPDSPSQPYNSTAKRVRTAIDASLANPAYQQFGGTYSTQVLDPMFMEPEAGLAWLDKDKSRMHLVLGTQATNGDMSDVYNLFSNPKASSTIPFKNISLYSCYPGGGFGGRDVSTFPPLLAIAAALADGPVRIAQDRYEQFQGGLKQLSSSITHSLSVDSQGQFIAFKSQQSLGAGGNNNYSQFVAMLAAYCGLSGYNIKQAYVDAVAQPSKGVVAGSMRGFGGPQASFAVETLVDEVAVGLQRDPIELRQLNALKQFDRTITGAPLEQALPLAEICQRARAHPLWTQRQATKAAKSRQGVLYGVGFALANQAYGTGTDGVMAEVSISPDGQLTVRSNCVDMGNGSATTLAISTAGFAGNNAAQVVMGDVAAFNGLQMTSGSGASCNANDKNPPPCDWSNPAWTASFSMSSSACLTAFHQVHVTEQATRVLFEAGLLPAAAALWRTQVTQLGGKTVWRDGQLTATGLPPLSLAAIAAKLYELKLSSGAMVHGLYQGHWVSANYLIHEVNTWLPIDGLALRTAGGSDWLPVLRKDLIPPDPKAALYGRSLYAPSGALVAVEIHPKTGLPKVVAVELIVDAGKVLQRDLLTGQAQGGIAMGIGYALLEDLPLETGGAGDGRWNLDRYHVALASDLPLHAINITTLPTNETTAKGIAEAVLCPIAPAIGNAIAFATGKRFRSLPIKASQIKEALKS